MTHNSHCLRRARESASWAKQTMVRPARMMMPTKLQMSPLPMRASQPQPCGMLPAAR